MTQIIKKLFVFIIILLTLSACTAQKYPTEVSVSIESTKDTTIQNATGAIPYQVLITQEMSDNSVREYQGIIHVKSDGSLFSWGLDTNITGLRATLNSKPGDTTVLLMYSDFDREEDSPIFIHEILWEEDHFEISKEKIE